MNEPATDQPPAQRRYADVLRWGTRAGLVVTCVAFAAYLLGLAPAQVPAADVAQIWSLSAQAAGTALADAPAAGITPAEGGLSPFVRADRLALLGIALLATCSVAALLAVVPSSLRRGERLFAALCLLEAAVILLAASGWAGGGGA